MTTNYKWEDLRRPWPWHRTLRWWLRHGVANTVDGWRWEATYCWQRMRRGWSDRHVWNLDVALAEFLAATLPQLRCPPSSGWPGDDPRFPEPEDWNAVVDEMAAGFARYASADRFGDREAYAEVDRSLELLRGCFPHLWD